VWEWHNGILSVFLDVGSDNKRFDTLTVSCQVFLDPREPFSFSAHAGTAEELLARIGTSPELRRAGRSLERLLVITQPTLERALASSQGSDVACRSFREAELLAKVFEEGAVKDAEKQTARENVSSRAGGCTTTKRS
jgi:hypothetical protein